MSPQMKMMTKMMKKMMIMIQHWALMLLVLLLLLLPQPVLQRLHQLLPAQCDHSPHPDLFFSVVACLHPAGLGNEVQKLLAEGQLWVQARAHFFRSQNPLLN